MKTTQRKLNGLYVFGSTLMILVIWILLAHQHHIIEKVNKNRNNLTELMNFIYKIHTNTVLNIMTPEHLENEKDLQQTFRNIKLELHNLSKLIQIERSIY